MIDATRKKVVEQIVKNIPVEEIISFEQLTKLKIGTDVVIMNNCSRSIGKIYSKDECFIFIHDGVKLITVKQESFKYNGFLYEVL